MAELTNVYYRDGHESFVRVATEPAPLAVGLNPTVNTLDNTAFSMLGYGGAPSISRRTPHAPVRGGGSPYALGHVPLRRENTITQSIMLSGGAAVKKFMQGALRNTSNTVYPAAGRTMCLPNIAIDTGAIGACKPERSYRHVARYGLINSMTIRGGVNAPLTVEYELWPLFIENPIAITQSTLAGAGSIEDALLAAGGTPYLLHNAYFDVTPYGGGTAVDWSPIIEDFSITISNNLAYMGVRHPGNTNSALDLTPQGIRVGNQDTSLSLTLNDRLPATPGTLSLLLDNGAQTMTLGIGGLAVNDTTDGAADPGSPYQFTTALAASQLVIA